ncbi:hypothetical protein SGODD07_01222 [Streptococcus gordonii]|uniref:Uncharacterized protein n=1 Tax=Streptococcus gordonii TaxID=1302 RepID=A0A139N632_STRGN|nr:hypothetical protein SGODD07_01222 [Streptococcus gordonii]
MVERGFFLTKRTVVSIEGVEGKNAITDRKNLSLFILNAYFGT